MYTPTDEEVREAIAEWAWSRRMFRPELSQSDGREADRWLAAHDAETATAALSKVWREYAASSDSDSLALLILDDPTEQDVAAWLAQHTAEVRAEWEAEHGAEVTDWEYGVTTKWGIHEHPHLEGAERYAAGVRDEIERGRASGDLRYHGRVMKRTKAKAGPWVPVEQEGESNADHE